jgi:ribosomal protein L37E
MTSVEQTFTRQQSRFKFVCERCGSLSIKVADPVTSPLTTVVECARCGAVRGTLGELHDLARRSSDLFEF